jgi:hypothetical protein
MAVLRIKHKATGGEGRSLPFSVKHKYRRFCSFLHVISRSRDTSGEKKEVRDFEAVK